MAVSQIEEKILGRLARQTAPSNALLSASLYQVLGLSILLSRKLYRARRLRKLDITRDTKSLELYHHIIWLAREGLSITEVYILPYCQDGQLGPECRVMAAKLRASLYHVFCLFHNHPPLSQLTGRSPASPAPPSSETTPRAARDARGSPKQEKEKEKENGGDGRRRTGKPALRDPIPSTTSDASYVTNPFAAGPPASFSTPPPPGLWISSSSSGFPGDTRKTPSRPPGLAPITIRAPQAAASYLLPPLNFLPMAREHFASAHHLATRLLLPTHALRLSVALEHAAFLWDCAREHDHARKLARRSIRDVYASPDGLDDDEFADASALVQALGGLVVRRSPPSSHAHSHSHSRDSTATLRPGPSPPTLTPPQPPLAVFSSPGESHIPRVMQQPPSQPPPQQPNGTASKTGPVTGPASPERLSTVPEEENNSLSRAPTSTSRSRLSNNPSFGQQQQQQQQPPPPPPPPPPRRASSASSSQASDKASKRRLVEQAEERVRSRQGSATGSQGGIQQTPHSRQTTPAEGYVRRKSHGRRGSR
ncbi:Hypothetical predicted protein [Lecanosticta acicola]|uniref:14-3-3 domain-containing protein n=1 Tax=Lecanosticta acicola TaxID=111012 RepID=A0AAI9E7W0_9PEZI|nr:Hypothetical predicted protein [Lecanosticta acicola]